jgi:CO/xanthine dehydrogenase FAD-binding subunit
MLAGTSSDYYLRLEQGHDQVNVPLLPAGARSSYLKVRGRASYEFALTSAAAARARGSHGGRPSVITVVFDPSPDSQRRTRLLPARKAELDPIDDRDRVESLSPLPRHGAVAIP